MTIQNKYTLMMGNLETYNFLVSVTNKDCTDTLTLNLVSMVRNFINDDKVF